MIPDWKNLPVKILHAIFEEVSEDELCRTILVCKAWLHPAQVILYSNVYITDLSQMCMFLNTVKNNNHLGKTVKTIYLNESMDPVEIYEYLTPLLSTLPNLWKLEKPNQIPYIPVLSGLMNDQLKHLKFLSTPKYFEKENDVTTYCTCALLIKDRLVNLAIFYKKNNFLDGLFSYIYNKLNEFKQLHTIKFYLYTKDEIETLEYIAEANQSIKKIKLTLTNDRLTLPANNNVSMDDLSTVVPRSNVEDLYAYHVDITTLLYMMHKFTCLQSLNIILTDRSDSKLYSLNHQSLTQLLHYFRNVNGVAHVLNIKASNSTITKSFSTLWNDKASIGIQNVEFYYNQDVWETTFDYFKSDFQCREEVEIKYPTTNTKWLHTNFIEKNGKFLNEVLLCFPLLDYDTLVRSVLPEDIMTHTFMHCPNLKKLSLDFCTLKQSTTHSPAKTSDKFSIKSLAFRGCLIETNVLRQLSKHLFQIESLSLCDVGNIRDVNLNHEANGGCIFELIMPYTKIDEINIFHQFCKLENFCVDIYVTSENRHYYYKYDFEADKHIKELSKAEYLNVFGEYGYYYISCKRKPSVRFQ